MNAMRLDALQLIRLLYESFCAACCVQAYLMRALKLDALELVPVHDAAAVAAAVASLSFPVDVAAAYPGAPVTSFTLAPVA